MDVDTVLASVQERDKWRHRLTLLEGSLRDVREQRRRLGKRLRTIRQELGRLKDYSEAVLDPARRAATGGPIHAPNDGRIPTR